MTRPFASVSFVLGLAIAGPASAHTPNEVLFLVAGHLFVLVLLVIFLVLWRVAVWKRAALGVASRRRWVLSNLRSHSPAKRGARTADLGQGLTHPPAPAHRTNCAGRRARGWTQSPLPAGRKRAEEAAV